MIFATNAFLFLFLPTFLAVYYLLPSRWRSAWILVASYVFYGWWRVDFLGLFFASTLWSFLVGRLIARHLDAAPRRSKAWLIVGVAGNLGVLAYFKYCNFGVDSLNALLASLGAEPLEIARVMLPIGISFYIFQATSYLVDLYRRDAPPAPHFTDLAAFISLFPQLVAGPILRYKDVVRQFEQREHTFEKFSEGAMRFMIGFCKKVMIADAVAPAVAIAFDSPAPSMADAWIGLLAYTVQIYFDFSGYSDMAVGLGLMVGFRFMENFAHPYVSRSITEFWQRWHISLSSWLRDYLFVPLGGSRRGLARTYVNLMVVMLLGGLWHGASWSFVIWGGWHGGLLALERFVKSRSTSGRSPGVLAIPRTLLLVMLGWVTFRAAGAEAAWRVYGGLIGLNGVALTALASWQLSRFELAVLLVAGGLIFAAPVVKARLARTAVEVQPWLVVTTQVAVVVLFVSGILRLAAQSFSPFLYFQF